MVRTVLASTRDDWSVRQLSKESVWILSHTALHVEPAARSAAARAVQSLPPALVCLHAAGRARLRGVRGAGGRKQRGGEGEWRISAQGPPSPHSGGAALGSSSQPQTNVFDAPIASEVMPPTHLTRACKAGAESEASSRLHKLMDPMSCSRRTRLYVASSHTQTARDAGSWHACGEERCLGPGESRGAQGAHFAHPPWIRNPLAPRPPAGAAAGPDRTGTLTLPGVRPLPAAHAAHARSVESVSFSSRWAS